MRLRGTVIVLWVLALSLLVYAEPWITLEFGPDEGMEYAKMLLVLKDPGSTEKVWNDQPWLYSQFFAGVFYLTGFQLWIPRAITLLLVVVLCLLSSTFVPTPSKGTELVCFVVLMSMPGILHLTLSAMCELPATLLSFAALAVVYSNHNVAHRYRDILAGCLFTVATWIKLTALLMAPTLLLALLITGPTGTKATGKAVGLRVVRFASGAGIMMLILCALTFPSAFAEVVGAHSSSASTPQAAAHSFAASKIFEYPFLSLSFLTIIIYLARAKLIRVVAPILLYIVVVVVVHSLHTPWWYYYDVHLFVPFALLVGIASGHYLCGFKKAEASASIWKVDGNSAISTQLAGLYAALMISGCAKPLWNEISWVKHHTGFADQQLVNFLAENRGNVSYVYSRGNIWISAAECLTPPELTILSKKRFWSSSISEEQIVTTVRRYRCEVLILLSDLELKDALWSPLLELYELHSSDGPRRVYTLKGKRFVRHASTEDTLNKFNLK